MISSELLDPARTFCLNEKVVAVRQEIGKFSILEIDCGLRTRSKLLPE